ncbi:MogA/MoaB family molybdenum cofactor biosynthesis protein [Pyrofollis japonicus]|uniref:MogA/MoaB family molybdenum cofactor biosynthesis protein n=1 Tax=Pyrofollis japonicus TaxID=3060460 RepID=UPI00295BC85A|nr:molybdopterin-binding protein [Pyrofollis japonicus]BEP16754.1 MogA/MoaB family molybdenum cofactor biosynthesis protein [Pyrofollis japonicus]
MGLRWALVITSDRVKADPSLDQITPIVEKLLSEKGHVLAKRLLVGNDAAEILWALAEALRSADIVLATGGTGPNPRDITVDIAKRICDRELPGIGEEFRRRSIERGVVNAMLSRATGCGFAGRLIAVSPGNPDAAETMTRLLLEIGEHAVEQLRGKKHQHHGHRH